MFFLRKEHSLDIVYNCHLFLIILLLSLHHLDSVSLCPSHLQAIYMFYALAIVCDDYFVPSLEKISEVRKRHLSGIPRRAPYVASA